MKTGTLWNNQLTNKYLEESSNIWPKQKSALMKFTKNFLNDLHAKVQKKTE